jgi:hypothetical protein
MNSSLPPPGSAPAHRFRARLMPSNVTRSQQTVVARRPVPATFVMLTYHTRVRVAIVLTPVVRTDSFAWILQYEQIVHWEYIRARVIDIERKYVKRTKLKRRLNARKSPKPRPVTTREVCRTPCREHSKRAHYNNIISIRMTARVYFVSHNNTFKHNTCIQTHTSIILLCVGPGFKVASNRTTIMVPAYTTCAVKRYDMCALLNYHNIKTWCLMSSTTSRTYENSVAIVIIFIVPRTTAARRDGIR